MNVMNKINCLNCGKDVSQTEGKREKKFCNVTCRSNYWQKQQTVKKRKLNAIVSTPPQTTSVLKEELKNNISEDTKESVQIIKLEKKPNYITQKAWNILQAKKQD